MNVNLNKSFALVSSAILFACAAALAIPPDEPLKRIDIPNGGHIIFGPMPSQLTQQTAMGAILHRVSVLTGDRPQPIRVLQTPDGSFAAVLFNVTAKNQDNKLMTGLALVSAPKGGSAEVALLTDYADRFPTTANPMFQRLKQELGITSASQGSQGAQSSGTGTSSNSIPSAASVHALPPQQLHLVRFPDQTGAVGLPSDWNVVRAQTGDVLANGPRGEVLRFGQHIGLIDPANPASKGLMMPGNGRGGANTGSFIPVRYGLDPAQAYKSATAQMAQRDRKQPSIMNIAKVQEVPLQGGKEYFMYGDVDARDGKGPQSMLVELIVTPPMQMGTWQMTVFRVQAPPRVFQQELATVAELFPSYSSNPQMIEAQMQRAIETNRAMNEHLQGMMADAVDQSDRSTAGMSNYLRNQTVLRSSSERDLHGTTSDDFADTLMRTFPGQFESVPVSQYIKGVDY